MGQKKKTNKESSKETKSKKVVKTKKDSKKTRELTEKTGTKMVPDNLLSPRENTDYQEFEIPIDDIVLGPHQPRTRESIQARGSLTSLKESIRELGLLQPILVQQQDDGKYLLISGERRFQSSKELGHKKIRAVLPSNRTINAMNERGKTLDELALFENLQRKNLTPVEEGRCFEKLLEILGVTQTELGERLGLKQAYISERINLLILPEEVQTMIEEGQISSSQARELGRLDKLPKSKRALQQIELAKKMLVEKITVRKAKKLVDDLLGEKKKRDAPQLVRLGAKKAIYFISTLNEKFDDIDLDELNSDEESENQEKIQQLVEQIPELIEKLEGLKNKASKMV